MDTQKKLYVALGLAVALGGGLYLQNRSNDRDAVAHSLQGRVANLPKIEITEEQTKTIDRIEITQHKDSKSESIVLSKAGEESWQLSEPLTAPANANNVKSLLDNLPKLRVAEEITSSPDDYVKWGLADDKALHAVFKKGEEIVFEGYFGDSGSRGQMTRLPGKDGVYSLKGYSKWLYDRDVKGWRDRSIFKFEDEDVSKVTVENENGSFVFEKSGEAWVSKGKAIPDFKSNKVDDLVRAYKVLSAVDFGDGKSLEETGLDKPVATVTIELTGGSGKHVLAVGQNAEGSNRWVKSNSKEQIFSISSWAADWATAKPEKFMESKAPANPHAPKPTEGYDIPLD
jgi:hypothetical protein